MVAMFRSIKYELYDMPHVTTLHVIVDDNMQQCNIVHDSQGLNWPLDQGVREADSPERIIDLTAESDRALFTDSELALEYSL